MLSLPRQVKSIKTILRDGNDILHSLVTQSQELKRIQEIIASTIPFEFAICGIKGGILSIIVSKATEATNVMYREEEIISALSSAGIVASGVKMKIQPLKNKPPPDANRIRVSENAAETVAMQAIEIGDSAISSALSRLSKTLKKQRYKDSAKPS